MNDARLQKKEERRWLKKAGFGKEMKDMGALAVELGRARGEVSPDGQAGLKVRAGRGDGGAAKRTLTDMCRECRGLRDECLDAVKLMGHMREMERRDLRRLGWLAGGLSLLNVAMALVLLL